MSATDRGGLDLRRAGAAVSRLAGRGFRAATGGTGRVVAALGLGHGLPVEWLCALIGALALGACARAWASGPLAVFAALANHDPYDDGRRT